MVLQNAQIYIKDIRRTQTSDSDYLSHDVEFTNSQTFGCFMRQLSSNYALAATGQFGHNFYSCMFRQKNINLQVGHVIVDQNNKEYTVVAVMKYGTLFDCIVEAANA